MSDIATRLRQCAADIRRTPVRLDTWIPLQQEAADTIDALRAEVDAFREDAANYYRVAKEADAQQAALRARVAELEATVARYRQYEYVEARHDETGRSWFGARYNIPERFHEVSNESGVPGPTARDAGNKEESRNA